jgi:hypothetical protein
LKLDLIAETSSSSSTSHCSLSEVKYQ